MQSSPNFNDRRGPLDMLVLHYTGMETGEAALLRMCDPSAEVSAHYMIWEDGRLTQLVPEDKRAWHAGVSSWQGDTDLNSRSIGIEIVNGGHDVPRADGTLPPYPEVQIAAVIELAQSILARHAIPQSRIVGHSDIAPLRKRDPGEHFPWAQLAAAGVGLWPEPEKAPAGSVLVGRGLGLGDKGEPVERLHAQLRRIGYAVPDMSGYAGPTEAVIRAVQRRFRPDRVTGQADLETLVMIHQLADRVAA